MSSIPIRVAATNLQSPAKMPAELPSTGRFADVLRESSAAQAKADTTKAGHDEEAKTNGKEGRKNTRDDRRRSKDMPSALPSAAQSSQLNAVAVSAPAPMQPEWNFPDGSAERMSADKIGDAAGAATPIAAPMSTGSEILPAETGAAANQALDPASALTTTGEQDAEEAIANGVPGLPVSEDKQSPAGAEATAAEPQVTVTQAVGPQTAPVAAQVPSTSTTAFLSSLPATNAEEGLPNPALPESSDADTQMITSGAGKATSSGRPALRDSAHAAAAVDPASLIPNGREIAGVTQASQPSAPGSERQPHHDTKASAANPGDRRPGETAGDAPVSDPAAFTAADLLAIPQVAAGAVAVMQAPSASVMTPPLTAGLEPRPHESSTSALTVSEGGQPAIASSSPLSAVDVARLVRTATGSELRVATRSEEFGAMTIHTVLSHEQLSAHISVESDRLTSALSAHLSTIQERLENSLGSGLGVKASVTLGSDFSHAGSQNSGREGANQNAAGQHTTRQDARQQSGSQPHQNPFTHRSERFTGAAAADIAALTPAALGSFTSRDRLDIRI